MLLHRGHGRGPGRGPGRVPGRGPGRVPGHSEITSVFSSAVFRLRFAAVQHHDLTYLPVQRETPLGAAAWLEIGVGGVHVVNLQLTMVFILPVINPAAFLSKTILLAHSRCVL